MAQKCIKSSFKNSELFLESGINQTYRCFELIGIYIEYQSASREESFSVYYHKRVDALEWWYRNEGVRTMFEDINKALADKHYKYRLSRRDLRRFGITYAGSRVRFYEAYEIVLDVLFKYIFDIDDLREEYLRSIHKEIIRDFLTFEYNCLTEYVRLGQIGNRDYYDEIEDSIVNMLHEIH